jgi:hypothetical protein
MPSPSLLQPVKKIDKTTFAFSAGNAPGHMIYTVIHAGCKSGRQVSTGGIGVALESGSQAESNGQPGIDPNPLSE